jgi:hypothetical protein
VHAGAASSLQCRKPVRVHLAIRNSISVGNLELRATDAPLGRGFVDVNVANSKAGKQELLILLVFGCGWNDFEHRTEERSDIS